MAEKIDFSNFQIPEPTEEELKEASAYFKRSTPKGPTFRIDAIGDGNGNYVATSVKRIKTQDPTDN